jgi:GT2 family glycosyltransferase
MTRAPAESSLIGIVTVLYNSDEVLPDFFTSLAAQDGVRFRLYVIDNSATDSGSQLSREFAARHGIDAAVVFNGANAGVARGNNQGIEMALADGCTHVLLANNDTAFEPATVRRLLDALGQDDLVSTPKIMYHDEPELLWYGGGRIDALTMRTPHFGMKQRDSGQFDHQTHVGYAPTCFMMIAADVFSRVGRMDEQFFVYYDDTDFVWRMARAGIGIRYVPESVVLHKVSTSTGGERSPFTLYYTNRNRVYFIRKNLHGWRKVAALSYMLATRMPRLGLLPPTLGRRGWRGISDGFKMAVPKDAQ